MSKLVSLENMLSSCMSLNYAVPFQIFFTVEWESVLSLKRLIFLSNHMCTGPIERHSVCGRLTYNMSIKIHREPGYFINVKSCANIVGTCCIPMARIAGI